jgi:hypothetical protein
LLNGGRELSVIVSQQKEGRKIIDITFRTRDHAIALGDPAKVRGGIFLGGENAFEVRPLLVDQ